MSTASICISERVVAELACILFFAKWKRSAGRREGWFDRDFLQFCHWFAIPSWISILIHVWCSLVVLWPQYKWLPRYKWLLDHTGSYMLESSRSFHWQRSQFQGVIAKQNKDRTVEHDYLLGNNLLPWSFCPISRLQLSLESEGGWGLQRFRGVECNHIDNVEGPTTWTWQRIEEPLEWI